MRIDKFLKISLIFKTRSSGDKLIDDNRVFINNKPTKSSSTVKIGDTILIITTDKKTTYQVKQILEKNVSKELAKTMYEIINEESNEF
ncbi:MAG: hypothetical protein A2015_10195 [Spirochaetes bacterium GWF1_31_7]|nr:MAG: hypothetical protein A2Y30_05830 [Spirochaetes bacterium GWE1_32_154]OHD49507.1 MAG: hypothetical protein A2Y29_01890 [Spirochaetes bacterium GWE2_31_10]OHD49700.1 MAG: hypothetical protein A2015_10195 [Spirochaetes bacterium GWF1_31_7]OHD83289.1 MAG: hypothetical protein A2355_01450 [Spirochaetes bacterium RIFOXYB1_FULL_32_8]HBD96249.1 hypothetical protein [Spirochaetia bacterium]